MKLFDQKRVKVVGKKNKTLSFVLSESNSSKSGCSNTNVVGGGSGGSLYTIGNDKSDVVSFNYSTY